ncbi:MAG: pitrilysin family protein [Candidatus Zixiibacteriota bacterium]
MNLLDINPTRAGELGLKSLRSRLSKRASAITLVTILAAIFSLGCGPVADNQLVVLKKPGLPVIYYRVMINAGSALDPVDKPGLAYFTANLLDKGTRNLSRADIERRLNQIGAEISISVDKEVVVVSGRTLSENAGEFYSIFREILTEPAFSDDEIRKAITDQIDQIGRVREDDAQLSLAVFENAIFDGHRYGHVVEGAEDAVRNFNRRDVVEFYHANYLRGNVLAGIGGDIEDSLVERFKTDLGNLPSGKVVRSDVAPKLPKTPKVILVEKENRTQAQLRVGHVLEDNRTSPQYYPMRLLGCYLGEHREMFGRLFQTVRAERGLAYGAYAYIEHFRPAGWSKLMENGIPRTDQYFHMWSYPKEINFEFCVKLMLTEMTKLTTTPLTAEEIDRTKDYVANNSAFAMETPDRQLGMRLDEKWYNIPDYVDKFKANINRVPRSELQSIALDNLHPGSVLIVAVVSDGEAAKRELLTPDTKLELPSGSVEGDLQSVNDQIKALDLKLLPEDITIVKAAAMFK